MLKGIVSGEEKDIKRIPMKGKNLADLNDVDKTYLNLHYTTGDDMTIVINGTKGNGANVHSLVSPNIILPAGVYTIKAKMVSGSITNISDGMFFGINKDTYARRTSPALKQVGDVGKRTFTLSEDTLLSTIDIAPGYGNGGSTWDNATFECWLYSGSDEMDYEPYGYQEGWEVRDNQDRLVWGREDELQTTTGTLPFKGYGLPVKVKSLLGNAVQNGTPAPDNIITPEMCGVRTGNLAKYWQNAYVRATDGVVVSQQRNGMAYPVSVLAGQTITFSANTDNFSIGIAVFRDFDGTTPSDMIFRELTAYTYTATENCYVVVWCNYDNTTIMSESNFDLCKAMLNSGSTPLPYEPYGWKIPFENHGENLNETIPIYLGEVPTVRRVKKLVLDGTEAWEWVLSGTGTYARMIVGQLNSVVQNAVISSHFEQNEIMSSTTIVGVDVRNVTSQNAATLNIRPDNVTTQTLASFTSYLAAQYAAGTPVTVWYALANEQTGIVNEPLAKIGTYADELTTIQVHGLSAPLYGIGDYKDTLNLSTGVVTRKVKRLVLTGQENWIVWNGNYYSSAIDSISMTASPLFCTNFINDNSAGMNIGAGSSRLKIASVAVPFATSVDDLKAYLAAQYANGTPVVIWYVLRTPTTETVTVPTGMTGEIEGYLTQVSTPSPTNRSVLKWNGEEESGGTYAVTVYTPPEIPTTTGQNTLTVETTLAPSSLTVEVHAKKIHYGFKIDKSNDDSESAVIYTHDAVTMTPAHMDFTNDRFDYGSWGNAFFVRDCYPVALNLDGTESYRLDPDDYTKKTDGTPSDIFYELLTEEPSDWSTQWKQYYTKSGDEYVLNSQSEAPTFATDTYYKLTYSSSFTGNFMMAFPKVWFYRHEDSQYNYIEISNHRLSDDWKCYAHINASGQEVEFIYLPLFKGVIKDSKLRSLPGQIPQGNTTATDEVNAATALGSRWQIWDHSSVELINDLLTLMSKSIDSQGRFGKGRESGYNSSDTVTYGKLQTGTLIKGGKFKGFSSSYKEVKVFGIESFWANRWDRLQGLLLVNNVWKIKMTPPYNFTGTDFVTLSNASVPTGSGYLSKVQTSEYGSISASIEGGGSSKFYKDYFYKNATDTRVAFRGGYCSHGAACGFRYVRVDCSASASVWAVGASPVYK